MLADALHEVLAHGITKVFVVPVICSASCTMDSFTFNFICRQMSASSPASSQPILCASIWFVPYRVCKRIVDSQELLVPPERFITYHHKFARLVGRTGWWTLPKELHYQMGGDLGLDDLPWFQLCTLLQRQLFLRQGDKYFLSVLLNISAWMFWHKQAKPQERWRFSENTPSTWNQLI